jgi:hypothetical protein
MMWYSVCSHCVIENPRSKNASALVHFYGHSFSIEKYQKTFVYIFLRRHVNCVFRSLSLLHFYFVIFKHTVDVPIYMLVRSMLL